MFEQGPTINMNEFLEKAIKLLMGKIVASNLLEKRKKDLVSELSSKVFLDKFVIENSDDRLFQRDPDPERLAEEMFEFILENNSTEVGSFTPYLLGINKDNQKKQTIQ